ncbi:MAG: hypothetical protein KKF41_09835 [Actinobacteria bacterium]|nr:hypothetical protein [Actinomycetota bacterium]MBU1943196.1 hypothetical protein [Actinomycetota bacterium]MBU2687874.1 hypothetical protein [Actinomycetota bacterium]
MRGIVVYKSWWGSCRKVAEAIGDGPPGIVKGELPEDEVERARKYGREIGEKLRGGSS